VFLEFAELETEGDIKVFADKYGDLFNHWEDISTRLDGTDILTRSLSEWCTEIGDMRTLVKLWHDTKEPNIPALKELVHITLEGAEYVISTPKFPTRIQRLTGVQSFSGKPIDFPPYDVLLPARCALQMEINRRLTEVERIRTNPVLTWTTAGGDQQRLVFKPSNLLAAMWLQFAQAVTERLGVKQCLYCGEYFQVGPGARREDARFCKDSCRAQKWSKDKKLEKAAE
jgi:hypothetical protein